MEIVRDDKELRENYKSIFGYNMGSRPARGRAEGASLTACPILDTHTPFTGQLNGEKKEIKFLKDRRSRKIFSRVLLGLHLPGRYYFLTLTSSPVSPPLKKSYDALRKCLSRHRPGCSWLHVMTEEGCGVLHMVIRLLVKQKNLNVKKLRTYWQNLHKAKQIKILRVRNSLKLANYLSDQRKKRKLGSEMSWQDLIVSWNWSPGWIPKGFTKKFSRLWFDWIDAPDHVKFTVIRQAIIKEYNEQKMNGS